MRTENPQACNSLLPFWFYFHLAVHFIELYPPELLFCGVMFLLSFPAVSKVKKERAGKRHSVKPRTHSYTYFCHTWWSAGFTNLAFKTSLPDPFLQLRPHPSLCVHAWVFALTPGFWVLMLCRDEEYQTWDVASSAYLLFKSTARAVRHRFLLGLVCFVGPNQNDLAQLILWWKAGSPFRAFKRVHQ